MRLKHTVEDFLVVILIYSLFESCIKLSINKAAISTLVIVGIIEFIQHLNIQSLQTVEIRKH